MVLWDRMKFLWLGGKKQQTGILPLTEICFFFFSFSCLNKLRSKFLKFPNSTRIIAFGSKLVAPVKIGQEQRSQRGLGLLSFLLVVSIWKPWRSYLQILSGTQHFYPPATTLADASHLLLYWFPSQELPLLPDCNPFTQKPESSLTCNVKHVTLLLRTSLWFP